eukprot:tig00021037_g17490.t2
MEQHARSAFVRVSPASATAESKTPGSATLTPSRRQLNDAEGPSSTPLRPTSSPAVISSPSPSEPSLPGKPAAPAANEPDSDEPAWEPLYAVNGLKQAVALTEKVLTMHLSRPNSTCDFASGPVRLHAIESTRGQCVRRPQATVGISMLKFKTTMDVLDENERSYEVIINVAFSYRQPKRFTLLLAAKPNGVSSKYRIEDVCPKEACEHALMDWAACFDPAVLLGASSQGAISNIAEAPPVEPLSPEATDALLAEWSIKTGVLAAVRQQLDDEFMAFDPRRGELLQLAFTSDRRPTYSYTPFNGLKGHATVRAYANRILDRIAFAIKEDEDAREHEPKRPRIMSSSRSKSDVFASSRAELLDKIVASILHDPAWVKQVKTTDLIVSFDDVAVNIRDPGVLYRYNGANPPSVMEIPASWENSESFSYGYRYFPNCLADATGCQYDYNSLMAMLCPLDKICRDQGINDTFFYGVCGIGIASDPRQDAIVHLEGLGNTGKSTLQAVVEKLITCETPSKDSSPQFMLSCIYDCHEPVSALFIHEVGNSTQLKSLQSKIKTISGHDPVSIEAKNKPPLKACLRAVVWTAGNPTGLSQHLYKDCGGDMSRRLLYLPFNKPVEAESNFKESCLQPYNLGVALAKMIISRRVLLSFIDGGGLQKLYDPLSSASQFYCPDIALRRSEILSTQQQATERNSTVKSIEYCWSKWIGTIATGQPSDTADQPALQEHFKQYLRALNYFKAADIDAAAKKYVLNSSVTTIKGAYEAAGVVWSKRGGSTGRVWRAFGAKIPTA